MDLDEDKAVCGTCKDWLGKRECLDGRIVRVSASAKGMCERLSKLKPPHGGCDHWKKRQGGETNGEKQTDGCG